MANLSGHPKCYARMLGDCSNKLSKEHYVSASILELLGDEHTISNASWLSAGQRSDPLTIGALGSNILCQRHNEALSRFDNSAKTFFSGLLRALSKPETYGLHQHVTADGDGLELWVLKAFCGALASGNLVENGRVITRKPPREWLEILFSQTPWGEGMGLYIRQAPMTPFNGYAIGPLREGTRLIGGGIDFAGVELFILMHPPGEKLIVESSTKQIKPLIYRPGAIRFESPSQTAEIKLQWRTWAPLQGVRYYRT